MFIKQATADVIIDPDLKSLKHEWQNIVTSGKHFCSTNCGCPFIEDFEWDPEHFLYYRARAITADQVNGNGDYFALNELRPSFPTFVGKGVYYNHDSSRPDLAFGIILDAVLHEYPDDQYVQILAAIDKDDIEKKRPGLLNRIVSGSLKTTSMSVAVEKCTCSVCGNVATKPEELCLHMRPNQPFYVKGKQYNGKLAFEYNSGLTFLEDSIVEHPADSTAYIFQIYANCNSHAPVNERLLKHFEKYMVKKAAVSNSPTESKSLDSIIEDQINRKLELKVKQLTDEKIRVNIDPLLQKIEENLLPDLDKKVETKVKEKEHQLTDHLSKTPSEDLAPSPKKVLPEESIPEKFPKKISPKTLEVPLEKEKGEKGSAKKDFKTASKDIAKILKNITEETDNTKQVKYPKIVTERVNIGNNLSFVLENNEYVLYVDDVKFEPKISVPLTKSLLNMDHKSLTKMLQKKLEAIHELENTENENVDLTTLKAQSARQEGQMKIAYTRGTDFATSFFVAQDGDKKFTVSAAEIIPKSIQRRIMAGDKDVVSPEDIIEQLDTMSEGSIEKLESEVVPALKSSVNDSEDTEVSDEEASSSTDDQSETDTAKSAMKKCAEFSWAESEVPTKKPDKPEDGPVMSMNPDEDAKNLRDIPSGKSSKIKSYYNRLPNKGVGDPDMALNVQSSINDEVRLKIEALRKELERESHRRLAAEQELEAEKEKNERKDKAVIIEEIIDLVSPSDENKGKLMQTLNKFSPVQLGDVRTIVELILEKDMDDMLDMSAINSLSDSPKGGPKGAPKGLPKGLSKGLPKGPAKGLPKGLEKMEKAPKDDTEGTDDKGMKEDKVDFNLPKRLPKFDSDEKPKMKSEASLPQIYLSDDTTSQMSLTQLAIKSLES